MIFSPDIWGPHYWFFLHTVAESYPVHPTTITKRKYYDLIQNMPLFIPVQEMGNKMSEMLDKYPVTPYLDTKESFVRWVHFLHNKFNVLLGKEEISLRQALDNYRDQYKPRPVFLADVSHIRKHTIHIALILSCVLFIYISYKTA
jgi:hypothetical protein